MSTFLGVDLTPRRQLGVNFQILPTTGEQIWIFWIFFVLNLLSSLHSAVSSFIAATNGGNKWWIPKMAYIALIVSVFCQLFARVVPVVSFCVFYIDSAAASSAYNTGPEWYINPWVNLALIVVPLLIRWGCVYIIYTWDKLASEQTRKHFEDMKYLERWTHIFRDLLKMKLFFSSKFLKGYNAIEKVSLKNIKLQNYSASPFGLLT